MLIIEIPRGNIDTSLMLAPSEPPAPATALPRQVTDEQVETYMASREVYRCPSVSILVDGFRFTGTYHKIRQMSVVDPLVRFGSIFFLSHYHSDHYVGLHPNWQHGTVYTGDMTADILVKHMDIPLSKVQGLSFYRRYQFSFSKRALADEGTTADPDDTFFVTLVDANHCPGAAIFIFESPKFGVIVNTGDFRYNGKEADFCLQRDATEGTVSLLRKKQNESRPRGSLRERPVTDRSKKCIPSFVRFMGDDAALQSVAGKVDVLFLDNTFCDPQFRFAPQEASFERVNSIIRESFHLQYQKKYESHSVVVTAGGEFANLQGATAAFKKCSCPVSSKCVHIAVLIGTYTIGKEKVALAVQEKFLPLDRAISKVPIFLSSSKKEMLEMSDFPDSLFVSTTPPLPEANAPPAPALVLTPSQTPTRSDDETEAAPSQQLASFYETEIDFDVSKAPGVSHAKPAVPFARESPLMQERSSPTKQLFTGLDESSDEHVACFLTIVLTPLQAISYPHLASSLSDTPESSKYGPKGDEMLEGPKRPARTLFLWEGCYLPLDKFDNLICVEPTGWATKSSQSAPSYVGNKFTKLSVPYSEHCSFDELLEFVAFLQPQRIVPTVSVEMFKKHEPLFVEKNVRLRSKFSNVQPLSRFPNFFRKPSAANDHEQPQAAKPINPFDKVGTSSLEVVVDETAVSAPKRERVEPCDANNSSLLPMSKLPKVESHKTTKQSTFFVPSQNNKLQVARTRVQSTPRQKQLGTKSKEVISLDDDDDDGVEIVGCTQVCIDVDKM